MIAHQPAESGSEYVHALSANVLHAPAWSDTETVAAWTDAAANVAALVSSMVNGTTRVRAGFHATFPTSAPCTWTQARVAVPYSSAPSP